MAPDFNETAPSAEEQPRDFQISEYWNVIVKRWKLIAILGIVSTSWALLNSVLTRPSYRATVIMDIENDRASPLDVGSVPQMYYMFDPVFLPTQIRLMRSREVLERVVKRLRLADDRSLNGKTSGFLKMGQKAPDGRSTDDAITRAAIAIQGGIDVEPVKDTNLIEISFVDSSPKRAAEVANTIAESYIDWSLESKYRVVGQASRFLATQIEQLRSELDEKQQQLIDYGRKKDIVSSDPQANNTLQSVESLNKDYGAAVSDRIAKEAHYNEAQTAPAESIADAQSNGYIAQLRGDQAKMEREYAEKLNVFKPDWPAMQQLKAEIDKGRQHLQATIQEAVGKARETARSDYLTSVRREESFKNTLRSQRLEAMKLNSNAVEYGNLKVEVETKRTMLDALLKRQSETDVMSRVSSDRESNIRVVDAALPPSFRFRPSYRHDATRGLFFGLILGLGISFGLEFLDRSLRTPEQVENYLHLPALGVIPAVGPTAGKGYGYGYRYGYGYGYGYGRRRKKKSQITAIGEADVAIELYPHVQPRSTVAEAYRSVRTALLLSRAGGVRSITITSCFPREGKSATAVNLAVVLGQLGKKVLLVDADLHKPRLHEILRISNRIGLVSILAENLDPSKVVIKTELPGVFAVPSGPTSPNPSGLLASEAMTEFLSRAAATFDFVLIDTPPVLPVADAILIGHQTDGVLLCARGGKTAREQVRRVRDKLARSEARILGVLINNLEVPAGTNYGGQYGYYGTYGAEPPKGGAPAADSPAGQRALTKG